MYIKPVTLMLFGSLMLLSFNGFAAVDHSAMHHADDHQHDMAATKTNVETDTATVSNAHSNAIAKLKQIPDSGKSREAGFDGRYLMEAMSHTESIKQACALASRGLMMLDNDSWKQCGGKPEGLPKSKDDAVKQTTDHQHMHH